MAIYLKYEGIEGDATQDNHKKWFDIQSLQWGVGRGIHTPVGSAQNREASEPSVSEISVTMSMDASSTKMFEEACVGKEGKEVTIDFCTTGDPGELFLQYKLDKVLVSGYSISSGWRPSQRLSEPELQQDRNQIHPLRRSQQSRPHRSLPDTISVRERRFSPGA